MQQMSPERLRQDLAIWLRLVLRGVGRSWCEKQVHGRDAAADAIARFLVDRLRHHEVWAPKPLTSGVPQQGVLELEPPACELPLEVRMATMPTSPIAIRA